MTDLWSVHNTSIDSQVTMNLQSQTGQFLSLAVYTEMTGFDQKQHIHNDYTHWKKDIEEY